MSEFSQYPLAVTGVPEITGDQLGETFELIRELRTKNLRSYGAYILRSHTKDDYLKAEDALRSQYSSIEYHRVNTVFEINLRLEDTSHHDIPLHADPGRLNDITIHRTHEGAARFMVVHGYSAQDKIVGTSLKPITHADANRVLHDNTYSQPGMTAQKTTISAGDMLLFDASLPHIFQTIGTQRQSEILFYTSGLA